MAPIKRKKSQIYTYVNIASDSRAIFCYKFDTVADFVNIYKRGSGGET
jgi:hypothetical protein